MVENEKKEKSKWKRVALNQAPLALWLVAILFLVYACHLIYDCGETWGWGFIAATCILLAASLYVHANKVRIGIRLGVGQMVS